MHISRSLSLSHSPFLCQLAAVHWITPNIENFAYFLCDISSKLVLTAGIQSCNFVHLHGIMKERELTLQTASKQKSDFFSYIFHEVRVPLNAVALGNACRHSLFSPSAQIIVYA